MAATDAPHAAHTAATAHVREDQRQQQHTTTARHRERQGSGSTAEPPGREAEEQTREPAPAPSAARASPPTSTGDGAGREDASPRSSWAAADGEGPQTSSLPPYCLQGTESADPCRPLPWRCAALSGSRLRGRRGEGSWKRGWRRGRVRVSPLGRPEEATRGGRVREF